MFEISSNSRSNVMWKLEGDLDWTAACAFRRAAHGTLGPSVNVLIDLSKVDDVDSGGMTTLLALVRSVRAIGGSARVFNVEPIVRRKMELAAIYEVLVGRRTSLPHDAAKMGSVGVGQPDVDEPLRRFVSRLGLSAPARVVAEQPPHPD